MFGKKKINIEDDMESNNQNQENLPEEDAGSHIEDILAEDDLKPDPASKDEAKEKTDAEKMAELNDKYLRLHADFENFRRRTNKEKTDLLMYGNKELLLKVLPVYDDFERALDLMQKADNKEAIMDGVNLIFNKFTNILQQAGLKEIEAKGQDFDPELHEAITMVHMSPEMKGKVVDQVQKGYLLNDKIIRHSKVVVGE